IGADGRRNVSVNQYHTLSLINPDDRAESLALDLTLQPGRLLRGTVVGPDGQPLTGVKAVGLTALPEEELLDSASFTVMGLNSRGTRELIFYHSGKGLGTVLTIRGDKTGPLMVQLDPYGLIFGRLVDRGGKPVSGLGLSLHGKDNSLYAAAETDRQGRFRVALLPGQKYSLQLWPGSRRLLKNVSEVEVESGGSKDLGDLTVGD